MNKHLSAIRKAGFGSLFTPTKAIRRVRAIAAYRTQASLTGGCFGTGIFRIYTEFCSAEGEPGRLGQPGRAPRFRRPEGSQGSGKPRHERGVAAAQDGTGREAGLTPHAATAPLNARWPRGLFDRARGRRRIDPHLFLLRNPSTSQSSIKTELFAQLRFGRRCAHATVQEVLARAIAASKH
jgi:hypothetical protein